MTPTDPGRAGRSDRTADDRWFGAVIDADRAATAARVRSLRSEIDGIVVSVADANTDDEHDPEGATIAFERARAGALLADAVAHLAALDRAEERLAAGSHAICDRCGGPIAEDRLAARPAAVTCVTCAAPRPTRPGGGD